MFNRRLLKELKEEKIIIVFLIAIKFSNLFLNIAMIKTVAKFLESVFFKTTSLDYVFKMIYILVLKALLSIVYQNLSFETAINIKKNLRESLFKKVYSLKTDFSKHVKLSEVVTLSVDGIESLNIFYQEMFPQLVYALISPVVLYFSLKSINEFIPRVLILVVPLIPISIFFVQKIANRVVKKYWKSYANLSEIFIDFLYGLRTLKVFGADEAQNIKLNEMAEDFRIKTMKLLKVQLNNITVLDLISYLGTSTGIFLSVIYFKNGNLNFYGTVVFILISQEFFQPLRMLGALFHVAMNGISASGSLYEILSIENAEEKSDEISEREVGIEIRDLNFSYDRENILEDLNMSFKKNGITAIVGSSGSGKSTIAKLISKELSPSGGHIFYEEHEKINRENLLKVLTTVDNNPYLFKGTLRYNLKMGANEKSDEELKEALKKVRLLEYFESLEGLDTIIENEGKNLSGGQIQRIAIARALLKDSKVLILDEAISNIDMESTEIILKLLEKIKEKMNIILITHRLKSTEISDYIYYLKDKKIKEEGRFEDFSQNSEFKKLLNAQNELERWGEFEKI